MENTENKFPSLESFVSINGEIIKPMRTIDFNRLATCINNTPAIEVTWNIDNLIEVDK